jgi:hypothetical protein
VNDLYPDFHEKAGTQMGGHAAAMTDMGARPPSVEDVLAGSARPRDQPQPSERLTPGPEPRH